MTEPTGEVPKISRRRFLEILSGSLAILFLPDGQWIKKFFYPGSPTGGLTVGYGDLKKVADLIDKKSSAYPEADQTGDGKINNDDLAKISERMDQPVPDQSIQQSERTRPDNKLVTDVMQLRGFGKNVLFNSSLWFQLLKRGMPNRTVMVDFNLVTAVQLADGTKTDRSVLILAGPDKDHDSYTVAVSVKDLKKNPQSVNEIFARIYAHAKGSYNTAGLFLARRALTSFVRGDLISQKI